MKNVLGTISVTQIAVDLHSFGVHPPNFFSRDFMREDQNYKESLGGCKYFQVLPKKQYLGTI